MATCIGHTCTERRYRANNPTGTATNVTKGTDEQKKACAGLENDAIKWATAQLNQKIDPADIEKEECPEGCKCYGMPKEWPADWTVLEAAATFTTQYIEISKDCVYDVTITYSYEVQERSGKCYRAPPTGKAAKKTGGKKKRKAPRPAGRGSSRTSARPKRPMRKARAAARRARRG
jgi:hypothetical protein